MSAQGTSATRRCCVVLPALLLAFGGSARPAALKAAQRGAAGAQRLSASWRQLRTPDFVVIGDAPENELRRVLRSLREFRTGFALLFPGARLTGSVPTSVVVFRDSRSFGRFQPRDDEGRRQTGVAGYASFDATSNVLVFPVDVLPQSNRIIFHEYAHYLINLNTSHMPPWLSEGLAEFFATFQPDFQGAGMLGRAPAERLAWLKGATFMPVRQLVSPGDFDRMARTGDRVAMFYAEAWALVHYILVQRKTPTPAPFSAYLDAIAAGSTPDAAFLQAFGADIETLDRELRNYVQRFTFNAFRLPSSRSGDVATLPVERVTEADVRQVQGHLLAHLGMHEEAEQELEAALAIDPAHVEARVWLANVRVRQGRDAEAIAMLQEVLRTAPNHLGGLYTLGTALNAAWQHEAALEAFDRALLANTGHAPSRVGLSGAAAALKRDEQARRALAQAMRLESEPGYYRASLYMSLRVGRDAMAADAARAYLDRVGFADESAHIVAFEGAIAHWRAQQPDEAAALLTRAEASIPEGTWSAGLLQFLRGQMDGDRLLSLAKTPGERTQAHAYIGFKLDLGGQSDAALTHFRWVAEQGVTNAPHYDLVRNELARRARATGSSR